MVWLVSSLGPMLRKWCKVRRASFFFVTQPNRVHATALYTFESTNADELAFIEGDTLIVVDRSETDWWKAERGGLVFIVPTAILDATEG